MSVRHGESVSVWFNHASMPTFPALTEDIKADVCIIGGGIAGLTTAYMLMKAGKSVCILESNDLASGQTGKTTAHFTVALDDRFFDLEKIHGEEGLKLIINSHSEAIRKVEEIIKSENIECELKKVSGYLFSLDDKDEDVLEKEFEASHKAGLVDIQRFALSPFSNFNMGPSLHYPKQIRLHPIKYLSALAKIIIDGGGKIFTKSHVVEVQGGENSFVKTKTNKAVFCSSIVVATNTPVNDMFAIHTKLAPYRTYVMGFKIAKGSFPDVLLWDTLGPYHYIRLENSIDSDILIIGGEDHKTGQMDHPEKCYKKLESWARSHFSFLGEVVDKWSGQVMESVDGLAYLGKNPMDDDNVYVITGDCGDGMTNSTIGALLITDQIMGRENPWEKLYSPSRISLMATKEYLKENLNVAIQYLDWLDPKLNTNLESLKNDSGVVFRKGGKMVAAYKNEEGSVEYMSAACPHLAGIVNWNSSEKSWDCPCHGSRFDCHGKVMEGPAISNLKPVTDIKNTLSKHAPKDIYESESHL
jgi:glycine/D-amino acid oxidase-like deaminating enzyme/nitrite reductase/ring-hydroxylating ferredoxin subunit